MIASEALQAELKRSLLADLGIAVEQVWQGAPLGYRWSAKRVVGGQADGEQVDQADRAQVAVQVAARPRLGAPAAGGPGVGHDEQTRRSGGAPTEQRAHEPVVRGGKARGERRRACRGPPGVEEVRQREGELELVRYATAASGLEICIASRVAREPLAEVRLVAVQPGGGLSRS